MKPLGPSSALCAALVAAWLSGLAPAQAASAQVGVRKAPRISTLNGFVENRGQWAPEVLFFAQRGGIETTLLSDALVFRPTVDPECAEPAPEPLVLRLPGAADGRVVEGTGELPTLHHFILASGSASDVLGYETVLYRDVQPGIDMRVRFDGARFAYDLLLEPGADLASFVLAVEGAHGIEIVVGGSLLLRTEAGSVEQRIGAAWQEEENGKRQAVAARFQVRNPVGGPMSLGFEVPDRDPSRTLVIDPTLVFSTYIGGTTQELLEGMEVDSTGATYLLCKPSTGATTPTTPGSLMQTPTAVGNLWVGKLSADGSNLEWGTFLGGSESDQEGGIAVDQDGTVVVVGYTWSTDFPVTAGSLQPVHTGNGADMFVTRLNSSGSSLVWSTFLGQSVSEIADAVALLPSGDVIVAARYASGFDPLPGTSGAFDPVYEDGERMILRISADGSSLVFLTYFSPSSIKDIAIDASSNIYIGGSADGPIPTTRGAFKESLAPGDLAGDAFVAKLSPLGTEIIWATYLGGDSGGGDSAKSIAVDAASAVYVVGAASPGFPTTSGAFSTVPSGSGSEFVTKLLPSGTALVWSTFLDTSCVCGGDGVVPYVVVDVAGNAWVGGSGNEPGWPVTPDAFQASYIGPFPSADGAFAKLDAVGETLVYSTWFGGSGGDSAIRVGLDAAGGLHIATDSSSSNMPVTPGAYQTSKAGSIDLVVAKFDLPLLPWRVLGGGLKGTQDTPNLAGTGDLTPNAPTRLLVRGAYPSSIGWYFVGFSTINLPLFGGTLIPWPNIYFSVPLDATGSLDLPFSWPPLAPGSSLYFQLWVLDPGAPEFFSASNALQAISQAPQ